MASDYGLNFGFRRSDESTRVAEGRFRTPVGSAGIIQIGSCVEVDPVNEGFVRVAGAGALPRPGICGVLLQEEIMFRSLYEHDQVDSFQVGKTKPDRLSVITNGPGMKVWFKNTPEITRADGRVIDAVTIVADIGDVAVGDLLGWNGTVWAVTMTAAQAHFEVVHVNANEGYIEATSLR